MNKLEKEIEERGYYLKSINHDNGASFVDGCQFILEKNLDEQFAEWLGDYYVKDKDSGMWQSIESPHWRYSIGDLKEYWLENVYGKD